MKIIIGLGNPSENYKNNRHNVGHQLIEFLTNPQLVNSLINNKEFKLYKADTFMNQSGLFVKKILDKHQNIPLENVYIVHDDLDIPLGKFKIDHATGPKLHNGIKSIEETLKTKDFWRIRIGVDNRKKENWIEGERYVLSNFTLEEKEIVEKVFDEIQQSLISNF